ncbi:hypothetical protein VE00_07889 [Pseudogymnoascus sp. WSF 3629]|nr:hypothetical protein VE00_07889 [Pseudogymnoascus sp. WSF 3629]
MPVSYLRDLFNAGKPQHKQRSHNAVKNRVRSLRSKWYKRWLKERKDIVPTTSTSSATSLFNNKYAWSAPELGIFIPLHPLLKNDQLCPSNMYPKDGGLPAFDLLESRQLGQEERQEGDEASFQRDMVALEIRSSSPEDMK